MPVFENVRFFGFDFGFYSFMSFTSEDIRTQIANREADLRQPGTLLFSQARYEILRILGEGGMGITCLADEISSANLKRPIVLKFVKDSLDPNRLAQFLNEVQLSVLFNHPNLVPVYRLETENIRVKLPKEKLSLRRTHEHTAYYAVMQYIDGWNVRELVNRLKTLGITLNHDITMFLIARVARGLHYVHNYKDENGTPKGLVHRDVSPENILLDRFGRIKVADFGLTRPAKDLHNDPIKMGGKLLYCAPEQLDGASLDARSDIFNIGLLMYFLFTNRDRFAPELMLKKMRERIRSKMGKSVRKDLTHVTPRLAQICEICLREDPKDRYQNCEDLATDIDIYFKESQKVVTNEQLEEILLDLFRAKPSFESRRYIPLTGSTKLDQPEYDADAHPEAEKEVKNLPTVRLDELAE